MKHRLLAGLLAPALLSGAAASQTIAVIRPLPFTGAPRSLPAAPAAVPLAPLRLPSPLTPPLARLDAMPAVRMDADAELPPALRALTGLTLRLQEAPLAPAAAAPAKPRPEHSVLFDGRSLTLPEDELEAELGLH